MEFYTNSIAQRTRLRRMKFEGEESNRRKKQQTGESKLVVQFNKSSYNPGDSVARSSSHTSNNLDDMDSKVENSRPFNRKASVEDVREFSAYDGKAEAAKLKKAIKTKKLKKANGQGSKKTTPSSKEDLRKGSKKMTPSSKEDLRKGSKKPSFSSKKSPDAVVKSKKALKFSKSSYNQGDGCTRFPSHTSTGMDYMDFKVDNARSFKYGGRDEDASGFSRYDSKTAKKEAVKTKRKRANDLEVGETSGNYHTGAYAGSSRSHGKNIEVVEETDVSSDDKNSRIEEIVISSEDDWDEYFNSMENDGADKRLEEIVVSTDDDCNQLSGRSDDKNEDSDESNDSDFVVDADSPSISLVKSSSDSEETDTEELISEKDSDEFEEDEEESDEKRPSKRKKDSGRMKRGQMRRKRGRYSDESPKRKEISRRTKHGQMRRKRGSYSDESPKRKEISRRMKHGQTRKKRLTYSDESLKRKETCGRMKKGQRRKKRESYSDETQESSDFDDEPTKKRKDKYKKKSQEVRSRERERDHKKALKRKKVLARTSHHETVSSPESIKEEHWTEFDDMHENTSSCDSDKEPIKSVIKEEVKVRKHTYYARRDCSFQRGDANEESEEEEEEEEEAEGLVRKPSKRKRLAGQKDDNEGGEETEQVEELTNKSVSGEKDDKEGGEETEQVVKPTKKNRSSLQTDDILGNLLKGLLGKEEPKEEEEEAKEEEEGLEENEAKPPSPVEEPIPLKFRFPDDDEFPPEEEKDEFELMVEGLFDEMNYGLLQSSEISPSEPPKDESESEDEKDQYARCRKGKHGELYFDEEIGLRCCICKDIILESKYVLGDLVDPPTGTSRRRDYRREKELPWLDDHVLEASGNYSQEACNRSKGTVWDTVPGIREKMYPHQQEGIEFLWKNLAGTIDLSELKNSDLSGGGGCIISHAPGTGKTRLTIVFLEMFLRLFPDCRPVIIAPVSIILTWEEEFRKWEVKYPFHNLNNITVPGRENISCKKHLLRVVKMTAWKKGGGVLGMSYSLFEKLAGEKFTKEKGKTNKKREKVVVDGNLEMLRSILLEMPGLVVLDEGHIARNQTSSIWNALTNLKTEKCIILSGTPFQNNFGELFNTLSLVRPAIASKLSGEKAFDKHRENGSSSNSPQLDEAIEKLKAEIAPFVHVHKGSILQKNLPGLRDSVVILSPSPLQKGLIESMGNSQRQNTFEYEHKVAMVSAHPSLILHCGNLSEKEKSCFNQKDLENTRLDYERGVKTRFVIELIRLSEALGEKVLIFSQFVQPLELIKDQLKKAFSWYEGKQVLHLRGKLEQRHRQKIINGFNDPSSTAKVMLASTKCCSEGIHLVGASRVVLLDVVWNPSVERQAICRAYRIGQKRVVYTYHLMTSGTNEGEKYLRQAKKDRISELVFCASSPSSKTTEEGNEDETDAVVQLDDKVLEDMVGETRLKDMFKKIILQPKETNFFECFGSESFS